MSRTRKMRRKVRAVLKHGQNARPVHKLRSGRTGKQRPGRGRQPAARIIGGES